MIAAVSSEVAGEVRAVNAKGLRLAGEEGWRNYSRWAGNVIMPEPGQRVVLRVDGQGSIRSIATEPVPDAAPVAPTAPPESTPAPLPAADRLSARLGALQAAVRIVGRPASIGEVLATAEQITAWLLR
jgi:hypothetical protein